MRSAQADALFDLAQEEFRAGRLAEAATAFRRALAARPGDASGHNDLGIVLAQQSQFDLAAKSFAQAIALRPDYAEALNNLGNIHLLQEQLDQAAEKFQRALAFRPDYAEARNNLGSAFARLGRLDEAAVQFQTALRLRPDYAEAHNNLGVLLRDQGQLDLGKRHLEQAIALRRDYFEAYNNLGTLLKTEDRLAEAAACFQKALALQPDYAEGHANLGNVLAAQGQFDEAAARYEHVLALRPDFAEAHNSLAIVRWEQGDFAAAAQRYQQALAFRPDYPAAHWGLSACYLVAGDFERGWPAYEGRLHTPRLLPPLDLPRWSGQPLDGRGLLVVTEQGLGDSFHFLRYLRLLKQRGARVVLVVSPALSRLLAGHPDVDELFVTGSAPAFPPCDFYLPLHSAPLEFRTTEATIPREVPYVWADAKLVEEWRAELAEVAGFKIGIVWQGARDYGTDRWRSIPLAQFAPLAALRGVRLISLQKGFGSEQRGTVDFPLLAGPLDEETGPFMDTAALIANLDLVVAANTGIAHLAGAMGARVFLALPSSPDWRWLAGRDDSPWYPTMRIFRQTVRGQWTDVFRRMAEAIASLRAEHG